MDRPLDLPRRWHHHRHPRWFCRRHRSRRRHHLLFLSLLGRHRLRARLGCRRRRLIRLRPSRENKFRRAAAISPRTRPALARRDCCRHHHQRHRRRLGRRQRKLPARRQHGPHQRARHRAHRKLQNRRTSPLPLAKRRRIVDAHHSPRSPRRGNFHPPAFLQRRIARRHPASHLHPSRRLPHARRAPLPQRRLRRPLRPPHPNSHRSHLRGFCFPRCHPEPSRVFCGCRKGSQVDG